jgi:hypothetical protein
VTENRAHDLIQRALDDDLHPDEVKELETLLDDAEHAAEYSAQQQVDDLLSHPPMERAPERLALTIMARIAQTMRAQQKASPIDDAQMQVAIQLVTVAALPLLVGAGYMLLNARTDPKKLENVLEPVVGMLIMVTDVIRVMIEEAEQVYEDDPELALAMLALIPPSLLMLVQELLGIDEDDVN